MISQQKSANPQTAREYFDTFLADFQPSANADHDWQYEIFMIATCASMAIKDRRFEIAVELVDRVHAMTKNTHLTARTKSQASLLLYQLQREMSAQATPKL